MCETFIFGIGTDGKTDTDFLKIYGYNYSMNDWPTAIYFKLLRWQNVYRREKRLLFPSPAELKLIELMGGKIFRIKILRDRNTGFPMAFVLHKSRLFKAERIRREVGCGRYWIDFGNDLKRAIEVDGRAYHDVVADFDREVYLRERGWRLLRIEASDLWRSPDIVQRKVLQFLLD